MDCITIDVCQGNLQSNALESDKRLEVPETLPFTPNATIIDVSQLFYHIA